MARLALQTRQSAGLVMTGALQQAIGLLQLSNQELLSELTLLADSNPLLVVGPPEGQEDSLNDSAYRASDLRDNDLPRDIDPEDFGTSAEDWEDDPHPRTNTHASDDDSQLDPDAPLPSRLDVFLEQIRLHFASQADRAIALALLDALDESGRLDSSIGQLADILSVSPGHIETIRSAMLLFEPIGCFALSLSECLAAQFRARNRFDPAVACLLNHLDWLARGDHEKLRKACGLDESDYADLLRELRQCNPRPGADLEEQPLPQEPDLFVRIGADGPVVSLNPATWPSLDIDETLYRRLLSDRPDARRYAQEKHQEAVALLRAVEQRARSLILICQKVAEHQARFLSEGVTALRPLNLAQIAAATGLHESTVSRVTASRMIGTPRGNLPLRRFFSTGLGSGEGELSSADAIKARIKALLSQESPDAILSDDTITQHLQKSGVAIQRRTVAKYREALGIAGSAQRRRDQKLRTQLAS